MECHDDFESCLRFTWLLFVEWCSPRRKKKKNNSVDAQIGQTFQELDQFGASCNVLQPDGSAICNLCAFLKNLLMFDMAVHFVLHFPAAFSLLLPWITQGLYQQEVRRRSWSNNYSWRPWIHPEMTLDIIKLMAEIHMKSHNSWDPALK